METKVKVSLLDYAPTSLNLQYYAPEICRQLDTALPTRPPSTPEGDVFAFGVLSYLLCTGRLPLASLPAHSTLYLMGSGKSLSSLLSSLPPCLPSSLASLVCQCWAPAPRRAAAPHLCSLLQPAKMGDKKLSISEPRRLDLLGRPAASGLVS